MTYISATLNIGKLIREKYRKSLTYTRISRSIKLPIAPAVTTIERILRGKYFRSAGIFRYIYVMTARKTTVSTRKNTRWFCSMPKAAPRFSRYLSSNTPGMITKGPSARRSAASIFVIWSSRVSKATAANASIVAKNKSKLEFEELRTVDAVNEAGEATKIVVSRLAEVRFVDVNTGIVLSTHNVPYGSTLFANEGETVEKGEEIPETGHKLATKNAKKATYFSKGYTGNKVCSICGKTVTKGKEIAKLKLDTPKMKVKAASKSFKVNYKKVKGATGFQVRYRIKGKWIVKNFNTKKSITKTIKKLKKGKKYRVQVRAFVKSGSKKAYSTWTKSKTLMVKK